MSDLIDRKIKKGTILKNLWAGYETYFIYMGFPVRTGRAEASKVGGYSLSKINGKWKLERSQYYRNTLKDIEHFPVVGHIDLESVAIAAVLEAIGDKIAENAPTIDAVEVVRCKDCKYWTSDDDIGHCDNPDGLDNYARPNDFYSYGERRM